MNLALDDFKRQLQNLSDLERSGVLRPEAAAGARATVERKLLAWVMAQAEGRPDTATSARAARRWWIVGGVLGLVVLLAAGFWLKAGSPKAPAPDPLPLVTDGPSAAPHSAAPASAPHSMLTGQIEGMLGGLEAKLKAHPEDADSWLMLARSNAVLGRPAEAIPAFRKVLALRPGDAQAQAGLAEALASSVGAGASGAGR